MIMSFMMTGLSLVKSVVNNMAYLWFEKKEQVYLISCDNCGVNQKKMVAGGAGCREQTDILL